MVKNHTELLHGLYQQLKPVFDSSEQALYLYLDDVNKACNKKFALLLGYGSPAEWAKVKTSFPEAFVASKSQKTLVMTYRKAVEKLIGSEVRITWKAKTGKNVDSKVLLVPISYQQHLFALHFVTQL